jgi:predicted Zn-dependent protease
MYKNNYHIYLQLIMPQELEILVRGPGELEKEKQVVEETIENIGKIVGRELDPKKADQSDFEEEKLEKCYRRISDSREFEQEFTGNQGNLRADDMTSVLILKPFTSEYKNSPVMYITDKPLHSKDRKTGEISEVCGATKTGYQRSAAVLSNSIFSEKEGRLYDDLLKTLAYHESGHLLEQKERKRYQEKVELDEVHCNNVDVMSGKGIWQDTWRRNGNQIYCDDCTEEIRKGIENY